MCATWYDGCNTCNVVDGSLTLCSMMYCFTMNEPECRSYYRLQVGDVCQRFCENGSLSTVEKTDDVLKIVLVNHLKQIHSHLILVVHTHGHAFHLINLYLLILMKGPKLILVKLDDKDITDYMSEFYGENNDWNNKLWKYSDIFKESDINKKVYCEFLSKKGSVLWINTFIYDLNQNFTPIFSHIRDM